MKILSFRYEEEFDAVGLDSRRLAPWRHLTATLFIVLVAMNLGVQIAAIWGWTLAAVEAWTWKATEPHLRGRTLTERDRLSYLGAAVAGSLTWLSLSLLFWVQPPGNGFQFLALMVWMVLLLNAISFAYRSRLALLLFGVGPATAMAIVPLLEPRFTGPQRLLVSIGLLVCIGYGAISAQRNVKASRSLRAAQLELEAEREAAEAANRAKSSFLAMMSHELRTPMNGMLGMAHALAQTDLNDQQRDYVRTLIRSGDGLLTILNDVLDLAKIEAGKLETEAAAFDLHDLIDKGCELWEQTAREKGLRLIREIAPDVPAWVSGDAVRVRQIIVNLLSNAIKFTETGEVRIRAVLAAGSNIAIAVSDTGPGIDAETQKRLFHGFTQADSSVARHFGGTGLGLAISRRLARMMGGDIVLQSEPGQGACFTLTAPLPAAEAAAAAPAVEMPSSYEVGLRVLVVDDNEINQTVARALLEAMGAVVVTAGDGPMGLEALRAESFDVVLMDIHMPGMSGIEVLQAIRAGEGGPRDIPVLALTADAMAGERERLLGLGFDGYLTKPVSPAALLAGLAAVGGQERAAA